MRFDVDKACLILFSYSISCLQDLPFICIQLYEIQCIEIIYKPIPNGKVLYERIFLLVQIGFFLKKQKTHMNSLLTVTANRDEYSRYDTVATFSTTPLINYFPVK